jgi:hypothetical protein
MIPTGSPAARLVGLLAGFAIGWGGYLLRASQLPDTSAGRAVTVVVVVLLCLGVTAATGRRLALWSVVLGAAVFSGAYEFTYNAAPPEVLSTSLSTVTSMLLSIGAGWLAASLLAPEPSRRDPAEGDHPHDRGPAADDTAASTTLMGSER